MPLYGRGAYIYAGASENFSASAHGGHIKFVTTTAGTTAEAERLRITETGNVGIGTTTPLATLDVNGSVRAGSSAVVSACGLGAANGEGTQRYNYTTHKMEYCNGTEWVPLYGGPVGVGVGVGQSWTNVTSSRALGTTYTNSTGNPILVAVTVYGNVGANGAVSVNGIVEGVTLQTSRTQISVVYNMRLTISFVVPNGQTYSATTGDGSTLDNWMELR